ncbi:glycoside hydrolase family 25 protein [Fomitiporia mediterranea MF3/22]|uniref:glycoside hydrolase family 25 protein n=1 Tax=Fomitiporia mediterranea (strain MF3/22) TaxID=694068 RepID=UPI0004409981|nr:glycoside hydrolase family 25 protein [Fomitiporia mediterranea MF3/22]EJD02532.1 glycoside hydrolase family 25 protein [Fomitiporia mediterranea MF3/22]
MAECNTEIHVTISPTCLSFCVFTASPTLLKRAAPKGIDVSGFQPGVNFNTVKANGVSFVYIKATEGTTFISDLFSSQYTGATNAGLIRGAYHFAHPDSSSGAAQANFFLAHGGGWSADGITLPGTIDLENNPNGAECYGLSQSAMVSWIKDFSSTYEVKTGSWWTTCTGNSAAFSNDNPLWIAHFASEVGPIPSGWPFYTFWQNADSASPNPGDSDIFNGDATGLARLAKGS